MLTLDNFSCKGQRALIRVDFNVPLTADFQVADGSRIDATIPSLKKILADGGMPVVMSHLGRPKGKPTPEFSLKPVAVRLGELLKRQVTFADDCVGHAAVHAVEEAHAPGGSKVVLLENLRFHAAEEQNDPGFAEELASLADVYIDDAFGVAHRAHASVSGMVKHFTEAGAGLLMEKELTFLGVALGTPDRPFVAIIGGAKVSDKIDVIDHMMGRVDRLLIGGAMAYTFFKALGMPVGKSLVEDDKLDEARTIIAHAQARGVVLQLPVDHVVAAKIDAATPTEVLKVGDPAMGDRMGLDIGPETARLYAGLLADAKTVVWNGPMGVFEVAPFAAGTMAVAQAMAMVQGTTIIGGGDSVAAVNAAHEADKMTHISTGGGASLEFLGGASLPGVAALPDKK